MKAKFVRYAAALALQAVAGFALALLGAFTRPLPVLYRIFMWALVPAFSACSAYLCVRRGVNAYLAWILPPITETLAGFTASMGCAPPAGPVLVCTLVSLMGAAAGDVRSKRERGRKGR